MELTQKEVNEKLTERGFRVKPENKLALSIKELKNILESFESLFKFPRLYLSKRFDTIRSEIDLAYEKQATIRISEEMKNKLKDNYLSMINLVNSHETECFKHFPKNQFESQITAETQKCIDLINSKIQLLENAVKDGKGEPTFDVNGDPEEDSDEFFDDIQLIEDLIYDQKFKLEKTLMQNKTLLFLEETSCLADTNKVFSRMDYLTTAGKLYFITNEYFGKRGLHSILNKIAIDGSYMQRLTNETTKSMHLKKYLEDNPTSNQIEQMIYPTSSFDKFEIINRQVRFLHADMFQGLKNLKYIDLNFNIIKEIDENLFRGLNELETLILLKNKIEFIPATTLRDLKNLKLFHLRENHLNKLDAKTFQGCDNLEVIYFYYNRLKSIPNDVFNGLSNLREIYLGGNFLTRLDKNLFKGLKSLRELYLSHNQISDLDDDAFKDLDNLVSLMLNNNRLSLLTCKMLNGLNNLKKLWVNE
jgi:hypothetical protein